MQQEEVIEQIRAGLLLTAIDPSRGSSELDRVVAASRGMGRYALDEDLYIALRDVMSESVENPALLFGVLLAAADFGDRIGRNQVGPFTHEFINNELLGAGSLERYRTSDNIEAAMVRGGLLQLATACGLDLDPQIFYRETTLMKHARPTWLSLVRRHLSREFALQRYIEAINEGAFEVHDLLTEVHLMIRESERKLANEIACRLDARISAIDQKQSEYLREALEDAAPNGWDWVSEDAGDPIIPFNENPKDLLGGIFH